MRLVFPTVTSCGFGNNVITLAKAHLIAESCQMTYQAPVWPWCEHVKPEVPNGYGYYFPSSPADKRRLKWIGLQYRMQRKLPIKLWPTLEFDRNVYARIGIEDVGECCRAWLKEMGLDDPSRSLVLTTSGMWGQYGGIKRARGWMNDLLLSHEDTRRRLEEIKQRSAGRLRVAVQIRMGDFVPREQAGAIVGGERVVRLPMEWYARLCRLIRQACDCDFLLVTDGQREELEDFLHEFEPIHLLGQNYNDLLGVLLMSHADLVVCSNSTYSRLGVFLNDRPYIWCADTLVPEETGRWGYLWKEDVKPVVAKGTPDLDAVRRCFALPCDFGELPGGLRRYLASGGTAAIEVGDDLLYHDPVELLS